VGGGGNRFGIAAERDCDAETKKPLGNSMEELLKGGEISRGEVKPV